jgi:hypothetical protein
MADSTARIHRQALRHGDRVVKSRGARSSPNEYDGSILCTTQT